MSIIKRLGLVCALVACAMIAVQCGLLDTSTTTGPIDSADGGTSGTGTGTGTPGPSGW